MVVLAAGIAVEILLRLAQKIGTESPPGRPKEFRVGGFRVVCIGNPRMLIPRLKPWDKRLDLLFRVSGCLYRESSNAYPTVETMG